MKILGSINVGEEATDLRVEKLGALPTANADDKSRLIYSTNTNKLYYSTGASYIQLLGSDDASAIAVSYDGTNVTTNATTLNFVGAGITAVNNDGVVTITVQAVADNTSYNSTTWALDTTKAPTKKAISDKIESIIAANTVALSQKQDTLNAGSNITIAGNVISSQASNVGLFDETLTGAVNGVNTVFSFSRTPIGDVQVYINGNKATKNTDYSVSGSAVTFTAESTPQTGDIVEGTFGSSMVGINGLPIKSDVTGISGATAITNIVSISQANYDALPTKSASTFYIING